MPYTAAHLNAGVILIALIAAYLKVGVILVNLITAHLNAGVILMALIAVCQKVSVILVNLITAHRNVTSSCWWPCSVRYSQSPSWDLGPRQITPSETTGP